jgi:hypothetical protein
MSDYGSRLLEQHAAKLASSVISVEVADERGYVSADTRAQLERYGFGEKQRRVPAMVMPLHSVIGEIAGYQVRPDDPRVLKGKPAKYETRAGQRMMLDVPPRVRPLLGNPAIPLVITEGPLKADAAVSAGLCCVALLGVWSWRGKNEANGSTALADFEYLALKGRLVVVCFDSDAMLKEQVHEAMARFGKLLEHRGADVAYAYLPHGVHGAKTGLDDWLAAGHVGTELFDLATPALRDVSPSQDRATAQPPLSEPPSWASDQRILDRFTVAVHGCGVVGENATAQLLYLAITSRLSDKPVSIVVKGHSASGKSYTTQTTAGFFPRAALIEMTGMSEKALVYSTESYEHRTIVLYEATALREAVEDTNHTAYFVRSLLSEGRLEYPVTMRDRETGEYVTKTVVKNGPTNLIVTTTKTKVHAENETRLLTVNTDDSRDQTKRVLAALADERSSVVDLAEWHALQSWLQQAEHRVTIPYARPLAELVPPVAIRMRRDFGQVLALIRAHAILHQQSRARDREGRIVANLDDYAVVRELVAGVVSEGVGATVPPTVRETVDVVAELAPSEGVVARVVAERLDLDKSSVSRRLRMAAEGGWLRNLEDKRGRPGRWVVGDPMPEQAELLPQPHNLPGYETAGQADGCAVAPAQKTDTPDTDVDICVVCGHPCRHVVDGQPRHPMCGFEGEETEGALSEQELLEVLARQFPGIRSATDEELDQLAELDLARWNRDRIKEADK